MMLSICNVRTNLSQKEITAHGSTTFPVACYEDDMELISVPIHWHEEFEFILAVEGRLTLHLGTEQLYLTEGSAVLINSGCLHFVETVKEGPSVLKSLVIHPKLIGGYKESCFWKNLIMPFSENSGLQYIVLDGSESWHDSAIRLMMDAWNAITCERYDFENDSRYFISRAFRLITDHGIDIREITVQNSNTIKRMKQLLQYIDEHYAEDITNQVLMEQISCSESVLLRSFKQTVGTSPMRYIKDYRIEKAASMLLSTSKKSCEIAMECGFNDFSYFTKVFRQKMGKTPVEYRNYKH